MPPSDYERFRQQVDEQLLADLQMIYDAYLAKVRAYETLALTHGASQLGAVPTGDYERFRQQADEQLLADLQKVYDAYLAKIRAYETLALTRGALPTGLRPPLSLNAATGAAAPRLVAAAEPPAQLPAPAVAALPDGPSASTPPPSPAAPGRRKRSARFELRAAVLAALDQLGDTFDRDELLQVLPFEPRRSSLHHVLQDLVFFDQVLEIVEKGRGAVLSVYRKRQPDSRPIPAERTT